MEENVAFGLKINKIPTAEIKKRVDHAIRMNNLEDLRKRKPRELSGGQRQRVAIARAIASQQPICLMDEPLSNLDALLRVKMRGRIRRLQQKLGLTIIYVTHDQVEAMTMADRIMVINDHQLTQIKKRSSLLLLKRNFLTKTSVLPQPESLNANYKLTVLLFSSKSSKQKERQSWPQIPF